MSEFFKFSVSAEGLESEISSALGDVEKKIPGALQFVGAEMQDALVRHLREDWYEAWGAPQVYERDTDKNPAKGLMSKNRMRVEVNGGNLLFDYVDAKRRSDGSWTDEDEVIKIIGSNSGWEFQPKKDKLGRTIIPRPFWNNFVEEMKNEGIINALVSGMKQQGETVQKDGKDVEFGANESLVN